MEEGTNDTRRSTWSLGLWLIVLVLVYLAAAGPFCGLVEQTMSSDAAETFLTVVYYPLILIDEHTNFFQEHPVGIAYAEYVEWFVEDW